MSREIERDLSRFKQIVKGKVRQQLRKYISSGEMIGRKGREYVSIPVPNINLPHFPPRRQRLQRRRPGRRRRRHPNRLWSEEEGQGNGRRQSTRRTRSRGRSLT
jgi:uncharacterized sporulation protein YeaH/YhbH (DUF444 family)